MCISSRDGKNNNNNTLFTTVAAMSSKLKSIICKYICNLGYLYKSENFSILSSYLHYRVHELKDEGETTLSDIICAIYPLYL